MYLSVIIGIGTSGVNENILGIVMSEKVHNFFRLLILLGRVLDSWQ